MLIIALDLATSTGCCVGSGDKTPDLRSVTMPSTGDDVGPFLDFFDKWLHALLTEAMEDADVPTLVGNYGPVPVNGSDLIVIMEAPVLMRAKIDEHGQLRQAPTTLATTRKLQGLAGVAEMVCFRRRVEIRETHNQTVKAALGGSKGKVDMMATAKKCGLTPKNFDEADAFGVWIVGLRSYARQFQQLWDQRLYGPRPGNLNL